MWKLLVLLVVLITGCTDTANTPLRVGTTLWPGYEPLHLAQTLGYINPSEISLVDSISPHGSIQGMRNGDLDAVALTLDEVLMLASQGVALKIVLVFDFSNGGDALLSKQEIKSVAELKGKNVGLESTALGSYFLSRALEKHGLELNDVNRRYMKVSSHKQAMDSGIVDAVVTFDPVKGRMLSTGVREIFSSREIPGEIVDVLAVEESALASSPERVRHLIAAWYRGLDYLEANPQQAILYMSRRLKQSPDDLRESLAGIRFLDRNGVVGLMADDGREAPLVGSAQRLATVMKQLNMLNVIPEVRNMVAPEYIR